MPKHDISPAKRYIAINKIMIKAIDSEVFNPPTNLRLCFKCFVFLIRQ